jgi:hypothetical protein
MSTINKVEKNAYYYCGNFYNQQQWEELVRSRNIDISKIKLMSIDEFNECCNKDDATKNGKKYFITNNKNLRGHLDMKLGKMIISAF